MSIFKCKMCGGALEINNESVATCDYCGTAQTLPKLDDDKKANLYDRANHFRRNNEFDKAMAIYEQILNEDNTDAESYWSLVLCRYGIEYVEDPSSHKRVPTVNRAQFTAVFDDDNYKSALEYADSYQKSIYEEEAKAINEIQKGILEISQKEEPFDVFICYKETDNNGRRTPDSVLANDLYHQLTQEGFKVFFARITLEDKLGSAYEPYIFAALNSSKVMVALGTKPEYFNAVWVKNEWSRYLGLIKKGDKKILIPAYKDMDPYDLPEEFSHLQAQDMSKLGFMQDLIRGIKKIVNTDEPKTTVVKETVVTNTSGNTEPLLKRAFMFLEDRDWNSADEYCEKVLDIDPENARAYLGKLMAELQISKQENLKDCQNPFEEYNNYQKAIRFADKELKSTLNGYIEHIKTRNENARLEEENRRTEETYLNAKRQYLDPNTEIGYLNIARMFESIRNYKDSFELAQECYKKSKEAKNEKIYGNAIAKMRMDSLSCYEEAVELFESISGFKDADKKLLECKQKIEELKIAKEKRKQQYKKIAIIATPIIAVIIVFVIILNTVIIPNRKYNDAVALMKAEKYSEAITAFETLDGYKDSDEKIEECNTAILEREYQKALDYLKANKYKEALSGFNQTIGYKDSNYYISRFEIQFDKIIDRSDSGFIWNITSCKYDENGYITNKVVTDNDNEIQLTNHYDYDQKGNLISETITDYDYSGNVDSASTIKYKYDENNNLIKITSEEQVVKCTYNEEGGLIKSYEDWEETYEYVCDKNGNVLKEAKINIEDGYVSVDIHENTYNKDGKLVKKVTIPSIGEFYETTTIYSYDKKGNLFKEVTTDYAGNVLEYKYGKLVKEIKIDNEYGDRTILYSYNSLGMLSKKTVKYEDEYEEDQVTLYDYEGVKVSYLS